MTTQHPPSHVSSSPRWGQRFPPAAAVPWVVGLLGAIVTLLLWDALRDRFAADLRRQTELAARGAAADLGGHLDDRVLALVRMAQRIEHGPRSLTPWQQDARLHLAQYDDLLSLALLDTAGRLQARLDRPGLSEPPPLHALPRPDSLLQSSPSRLEARPVAVHPGQNGSGPSLLIMASLRLPSAEPGSLVAVWRLDRMLALVDSALSEEFLLHVEQEGRPLFHSQGAPASEEDWARVELDRSYGLWEVRAAPVANGLAAQSARRLTSLMLAGGLLGSGLVAITLQSRRRTRVARDRTSALADQLRGEVASRAEAQESLEAARARLRFVLNALPVGVWLVSPDGVPIDNNPAALRIWGGADFLGPGGELRFTGLDPATEQTVPGREWVLSRSVERQERSGPETLLVLVPDGRRRMIVSEVAPLEDRAASGGPAGYVLVSDDISERHALEVQLQQARRLESIGRLAGGVAHDFNNIITVILTGADLLLKDVSLSEMVRDDVREIRAAAQRAATLTAQLLAFGRRTVMRPVSLDLNQVLRGLMEMLGRIIGEHIQVDAILEEGLPPILMDRTQLEQVILNLVFNARDAMPDGGVLTVETREVVLDQGYVRSHAGTAAGRYVLLAISDTGQGMSEEVRKRIFEPFFTTKTLGKGTGLGLATVHGIIHQSGGWIWVYSEPGLGTTFRVYLPLADVSAVPRTLAELEPVRLSGTESLLLVEDDAAVRAATAAALRQAGYQVHEASGREEAVLLVRQGLVPALLITDVVLQEGTGADLASAIQVMYPDVPVLFTSGYTSNTIMHHGVLDPGVLFLPKPYAVVDLLRLVRAALDRPAAGDA